jgi:hypothetical protein
VSGRNTYDDEEDAIRIANDLIYDLHGDPALGLSGKRRLP